MQSDLGFFLPLIAAIFGLLIGSFLNVCIYRIVRGQSVITPRSYCPTCLASIDWYDNFPVLSYLYLRGRCRRCQAAISARYPMVELLTALAFAVVAARYGLHLASFKWWLFESLIITLAFTDLEERLLPDELTIGGTVLGVIFALLLPMPGVFSELLMPAVRPRMQSLFEVLLAAALLTLPIWALATIWTRMRGREMLGLGDVKLLPLIAAFLGLEHGISALLIGSVSGVIIGGGYIFITKKQFGSYELPLGTFFCLGAGLTPLISHL